MTPEENELEDPALKSAVRRAIGAESAPPALRARVERLLASPSAPAAERASSQSRERGASWRWRLAPEHYRTAAAAAIMLVALGVMTYQIRNTFFPTWLARQPLAPRTLEFPVSFAMSLARTHDNCALLPDHHLIAGDDFAALKEKLSRDGGFEVFAAALGDGWIFKGAGECPIESVRAAHLVFARGDDVVSIFSLPAPEMCGGETYTFEQMYEQHPMAAIRNGSVFYCVVGSCPGGDITLADIQPIFMSVQQAMCSGSCHDGAAPATQQ